MTQEESISLRITQDVAGLRRGLEDAREWRKEVNSLSKSIKEGLATEADFKRLRQIVDTSVGGYEQANQKIQALAAQKEAWIKKVGAAATVGQRQEAALRVREIQDAIRDIGRSQSAYAAAQRQARTAMELPAGVEGGVEAGGGGGVVSGALGMARKVPGLGMLLSAGGLMAGAFMAVRQWMQIEESSTNIALSIANADDSLGSLTKRLRFAGEEAKFTQEETIQAMGALVGAGGRAMLAGRQPEEILRVARLRGIDPATLAALSGQVGRLGGFQPGAAGDFLGRIEAMRTGNIQNPLQFQQFLQNVLPFLQSEGRFQPYTGRNLEAYGRMLQGMTAGQTQLEQEFIQRNMGAMAQGLAGAIRQPQGEAGQFFAMQALGLGQGASYYDVLRRQEQGLTAENLQAMVGRARDISGGDVRTFALMMRNLTGGQVTLRQAERLFEADLTTPVGQKTFAELEGKLKGSEADNIFEIKQSMEAVTLALGESFGEKSLGLLARMANGIEQLVESIVKKDSGLNEDYARAMLGEGSVGEARSIRSYQPGLSDRFRDIWEGIQNPGFLKKDEGTSVR